MSTWLRQSTAVDVMIGPELDSVDGNTVEGGLTITQPDIRLSKNGGAFAQKSAAQTLVHAENGWYPANLSTTDTNTLGSLLVVVHEAGALQAWREFMVVPANVYDSFFSTDLLQVDIATGGITSASFAAGAINAAAIASGAIDDDALAADTDNYAAKVWLIKQSSTMDEYGVTFYKNGQPLESGISSPVIDYIKKLSDGSILVNDASLTDQGNGDYYYGESTNRIVAGNIYMSRVTATIDGSTKFMKQPVGRDSA